MTEREKFELSETKIRILQRAGYRCEVCGQPLTPYTVQLAHRIPQSKMNHRKYGKHVIHSDRNMAATCSLNCNSAVIVHGLEEQELVETIQEELIEWSR